MRRFPTSSPAPPSHFVKLQLLTVSLSPTASFCTSELFTRSLVPFRPPAALISLLITGKEFHVDISDDDSVKERVMKHLCYVIDPRGWWHLVFMRDEENLLKLDVQKELLRYGLRETHEGVCLHLDIPGVLTRHLKLFVEDGALYCKRLRPFRKTHSYEFMLPKKMYQPSDVKAKMKDGVLYVTFTNLKKEDVDEMEQN